MSIKTSYINARDPSSGRNENINASADEIINQANAHAALSDEGRVIVYARGTRAAEKTLEAIYHKVGKECVEQLNAKKSITYVLPGGKKVQLEIFPPREEFLRGTFTGLVIIDNGTTFTEKLEEQVVEHGYAGRPMVVLVHKDTPVDPALCETTLPVAVQKLSLADN